MKSTLLLAPIAAISLFACSAQQKPPTESAPASEPTAARLEASGAAESAADDASAEQAPAAPAMAPEKPEKKEGLAPYDEEAPGKAASRRDVDQLATEQRAFDDDIAPSALSCSGARPHRDAICSIAERLCELPPERPSTTRPSARCEEARQTCTQARSRFKERCGD